MTTNPIVNEPFTNKYGLIKFLISNNFDYQ